MKFKLWQTIPWSSLLNTRFFKYIPGSREGHFQINNAYSLHERYDHNIAQQPFSRGHAIDNVDRYFLVHHYY